MSTLPLSADRVAALLTEIARRMELADESPFKVRAYDTAAWNLLALPEPLDVLVAKGKLRTIPGVGEAIAEKIVKLHKTGTHPTLEFLREQFPAGILEMLKIPGVGPKKAVVLFKSLGIGSLDQLVAACEQGRLAKEKGFGAKFQEKVLEAAAFSRKNAGLERIDKATLRAQAAVAALKERHPHFKEVIAAGDVRRSCEVCGVLKLVAVPGEADSWDRTESATNIGVFTTTSKRLGTHLLFVTGSDAHLAQLKQYAQSRGFTLTASGLHRGSEEILCAREADVYAALGLPYIEPELREGRDEVRWAAEGRLPHLVTDADVRGVLHCHTDASDGSNTLDEMAEAARKRGWQYFGVCDHSQSAAYARGLKIERVREQHALADKLNARYDGTPFRIVKGIESDILEDGALDYPPEQLAEFDFVVASVHSRFELNAKQQTARLVAAVTNPHTTILGHPTGRILLERPEYKFEMEPVLDACAKHGVVVEINADPHRLDLDWRWHQYALERGCLLSINPDAHDTLGLANMKWGVAIARKGGVPAEKVLNCLDLAGLTAHFKRRRATAR